MKNKSLILAVVMIVSALLSASLATAQEKHGHDLGTVHFPVSCSPAAQAQFDRAFALLHSFQYFDSLKAFTALTDGEPSCAMGYWGAAMSLLQNPLAAAPPPKNLIDGWAVIQKAKSAGAQTQRERDYIAAIELLYKDADKVDHRTRVVAYEKAMEQLALRYPDDREASIFYALALNMTALPTDKTYGNQLRAAAILEKVFTEQPNHPGVAHYMIHSYDYPPIANRGLMAARRYASIAPSAPHALHMPSHIFTRLGYWEESIKTNLASAAASKDHREQLHALDYMAYAYLQLAQDREAKRVLDEIKAIVKVNVEWLGTSYALGAIPARYWLERRNWTEAASLTLHPREFSWNRFPQGEGLIVFARALGAARIGDLPGARTEIDRLQSLRDALAAAKQSYWAEQLQIQQQVALAWLARAEGKSEEALRLMRAAADLEDSTEKHPTTPGAIAPARELLGQLLIELGQPGQALREFEASFNREPNRFQGLYGAARAAELSGEREKARTYYAKLVALAQNADTERPELKHARAFLAK